MVTYPSDWKKTTVGDESRLITKGTTPKSYTRFGAVNFVKVESIVHGEIMSSKVAHISTETHLRELRRSILQENDLLISIAATLGITAVVNRNLLPANTNQALAIARFKNPEIVLFVKALLTQTETQKYFSSLSTTSAQANLSLKQVADIPIVLPEEPEQRAISVVLSRFDEHLANLDELITKKKAIRDGALETLVSGRQRLSGFTGYWRDTTLGAIATMNPVTPLPDTFTYVDLESVQGTEMVTSRRVDKIAAPSRAQRLASSGDIFFQTVRPYQRNNYFFKSSAKDVVFSTGYVQIRTQEVPEFLFAAVQQNHFIDQVLERCTGTSYPAITPTALKEVSVRLPKSHSEQRAIAEVLSGMDEEIRLLAEERAKVERLKLGAMDDLLTGRVRLTLGKEAA